MECSSSEIIHNLEETIRNLEETIRNQEEIIKKQAQTILVLQSRVTELEARLGLHSGNSSFPPSRDVVSPPKPGSLHKKSGKKAVGQKNVKE